jgi:hypothetical protein
VSDAARAPEPTAAIDAVPATPPATLVAVAPDVAEPAPSVERPPTDQAEHAAHRAIHATAPAGDGRPLPLEGDAISAGCTPAQMRRFIKSRPWIPMHELRRRFGINGHEDDVTGVSVGSRTVYVGLPEREGRMLGELLRGGDVGYELSVDPVTPIVIGVFPMRPVARS